jgi:NCAIR mutase (PurE)-related protein
LTIPNKTARIFNIFKRRLIIEESRLLEFLKEFKENDISAEQAVSKLRDLPYQDLGWAKIDHHRSLRTGSPEVVLGKGKTPDQVTRLVAAMKGRGHPVLVTKTDRSTYEAVVRDTPEAAFNDLGQSIIVPAPEAITKRDGILLITGGTADLPVAEEAAIAAGLMGNEVLQVADVGVAGLHRLLDHLPIIQQARVLIVVAGMDAALAGVVAGLVSVPIIAVPTSTGYGASFQGLSALLSMLNSCAPGVAVVNIDNGFGAGYLAAQINRMAHTTPEADPDS